MRSLLYSVSLGLLALGLFGVFTSEAQAGPFRRRAVIVRPAPYYVAPTAAVVGAPGVTSYYAGPGAVVATAPGAVVATAPGAVVTAAPAAVIEPVPEPVVGRGRRAGMFRRGGFRR